MSIRVMTWAWSLEELPRLETLVLLALADRADDDGICWPSVPELMRKARASDRSVKRALASLRHAGLIETSIRSSQSGRVGNVYRLCVGATFSASDNQGAILAPSDEPVDNIPVDNPSLTRESTKGPKWPLAENEVLQGAIRGSQGATCGPLLPYIEPPIEPPASQGRDLTCSEDGVAGNRQSKEEARQGVAGEPDQELLQACIPLPMLDWLSGRGAVRVTAELRRALEAGWTTTQVYRRLNADPIPAQTKNRVGLVIYRVRDIASTPPPQVKRPAAVASPVVDSPAPRLSADEVVAAVSRIESNGHLPAGLRRALTARLRDAGAVAS